jgi:hypothetical protein
MFIAIIITALLFAFIIMKDADKPNTGYNENFESIS